ncbi:YceI family protein [Flagellimonas beolgyonensis]|uniref:YceI family protein n=1 Tax=Flagellimonas beolgyonensis TaxID=864064 RepID=UPI000F8EB0A2|nr:YceI family protein [Allomuricauda beolgyonensis]
MKKNALKGWGLFLMLQVAAIGFGQNTVWKVDPSHSTIGFSIDHLVVSETVGAFKDYTLQVVANKQDFSDAKIDLVIQANSIDTHDPKRDEHLRSSDFFNVEEFPKITFSADGFDISDKKTYKLIGTLQMHGVTKQITLNAKFGGIVKDPWGGTRAGLKIWGELDRYDFGLKYNSLLEAGGLSIGREVRIECRVELIKS